MPRPRPNTHLRNLFHTALLIGTMAAIAAAIGWLVWGEDAVIWSAAAVAFSLAFSQYAPTNWLLLLLGLAPHAVTLLTLALSRTREFDADLGAAMLTGDPVGLASALGKLDMPRSFWGWVLPDRSGSSPWLRSHPGTQERIQRLLSLSGR